MWNHHRPTTGVLLASVAWLLLVNAGVRSSGRVLPQDAGAAGAWQRLQKVTTLASAMHTTAHPDDEHGGVLTWLSRGAGVRVSLLSLTRGEAGDNAVGSELFDALGLIRTEELLVAGRHYGLDAQYFTTAADYGFSKRLDEALEKWGRESLLRDVVRAIRVDRPLVVISRFQGTPHDGHGQHQTAGVITREAVQAAGDPDRFPEQIAEGLRPWRPLKLYIGGVREAEAWMLRVDAGEFSPLLGESFQNLSRRGLSYQRSQNGGRLDTTPGPAVSYYRLVDAVAFGRLGTASAEPPDETRESSFFDGLDTTWTGLLAFAHGPISPSARALVAEVARHVGDAVDRFAFDNPTASVPALVRGLDAVRRARRALSAEPEVDFLLGVKARQFEEAVNACLGLDVQAIATPADAARPAGPAAGFAAPPTMGPVVPGQTFRVEARFTNRGRTTLEGATLMLVPPDGWTVKAPARTPADLAYNETTLQAFDVTVPLDAEPTRPYFRRASIAASRYDVEDETERLRPSRHPLLEARAGYRIGDVVLEAQAVVHRVESHVPFGFESRELVVTPSVALRMEPARAVVPLGSGSPAFDVRVEVLVNDPDGATGELRLDLPDGWSSEPGAQAFTVSRAGDRRVVHWVVTPGRLDARDYEMSAVATVNGREYREGYQAIAHRDLETRYLYRDAITRVTGIDVAVAPDLRVGYVMGIGDEVPAAIVQLGATVEMLDDAALATDDLRRFEAIVTGTRAYAVRASLRTSGRRLLDYVRAGGNLIVLYNTAELVPDSDAPYPGELPARSEEVSEEDSAVEFLARDHPVLHWPNRIVDADFDGWVEQRGSKFWSTWDPRYVAIVSTRDTGQPPQHGGWLTARYGEGHYTYFAYAIHRQLPYAVPGAYRLLANVLSLGRQPVP